MAGVAAVPLVAAALAGVALAAGTGDSTGAGGGGLAGPGARPGGGGPGPVGGGREPGPVADIPPGMLALYRAAALTCPGLPWQVLAGIGRVETDHGRDVAVSSAGAEGPMQFMPGTWKEYGTDVHGTGRPDVNDPADAVFSAARMLCADGAATANGVAGAVYDYNHSGTYVSEVLGWAATYAVTYGA